MTTPEQAAQRAQLAQKRKPRKPKLPGAPASRIKDLENIWWNRYDKATT